MQIAILGRPDNLTVGCSVRWSHFWFLGRSRALLLGRGWPVPS